MNIILALIILAQMQGTNVSLSASGVDTNHLYSIDHSVDLVAWSSFTNFIGGPFSTEVPAAGAIQFYRLKQEDGFLIWADTTASAGEVNPCPGAYVGYCTYSLDAPQFGWEAMTNAVAMDPARSDTAVLYVGRLAETGCGFGSVNVIPVGERFRFSVFFPTNLPSGQYPLRLVNFEP